MNSSAKSLLALLALALPSGAWACSICRCGDPTFNALGKEGISLPGFKLALDWEEVSKSQGSRAEEFSSVLEHRTTLFAAWSPSDRFSLYARVPFAERDLVEIEDGGTERSNASGLADPELSAQVRLWSSQFNGDVGIRSSLFLVGGVKTAWGENDARRDGERLDEHVQPGTGSTDWFAGISGFYQLDRRSAIFASTQYRETGRNDFGYRYGSALLLNVAYEHKLGARWDAVIEMNYRDAGYDEVDGSGELDANTGGSMVYATPRILFDAGKGWVLRGSAQLPLSQSGLHGLQHEEPVWNLGVTRLFGQ
ncbi:MAG TPA: hypothetical protein VL219_07440 [Steroidobacteraceae bacterium]|jgi:hypothetical protein|nr:hypothetical protein [Steroidobacteraceae bacterium]